MLPGCDREAANPSQADAGQQGDTTPAAPTSGLDRSRAGTLMPAVALTDPDDRTLNTAAVQGEPVLVNLWATWCAPCVKELPLLDDLAADYDGRMRVLTVSQDLEGAAKVAPFFAERDFAMLQPWLDPKNALGFALGGSGGLPVTVMYDDRGQEIWRYIGDYDWSSAEARALIDGSL